MTILSNIDPSFRPKSAKAQRTYDRLVKATMDEICESGGFTAETVSRRAQSSPATFFSYFPTKDDALAASFSLAMDDLVKTAERGLRIDDLLDNGLATVCDALTDDIIDYFSRYTLMFRAALVQLPQSVLIRATFRDHQARVLAHYRRFIELGQKSGFVRQGDPSTMADALMVMTQGLNNPILVAGHTAELRAEMARSLIAHLAPPRP